MVSNVPNKILAQGRSIQNGQRSSLSQSLQLLAGRRERLPVGIRQKDVAAHEIYVPQATTDLPTDLLHEVVRSKSADGVGCSLAEGMLHRSDQRQKEIEVNSTVSLKETYEMRISDITQSYETRIEDIKTLCESRINDILSCCETRISDLKENYEERIAIYHEILKKLNPNF